MTTATFSQPSFRIAASLPTALLATLGLILLMQALISAEFEPPEIIETRPINVWMEKKTIPTLTETPKPVKTEVKEQPQKPTIDLTVETPTNLTGDLGINTYRSEGVKIGHGSGYISDGEYLPIVKVEPTYPSRALAKGIEGWVIVEFTVTKSGAVRDAFVVDAEPVKIFDRSAVKAAHKFKYKPRVVDGEAVEVAGVRNKISFAIAK